MSVIHVSVIWIPLLFKIANVPNGWAIKVYPRIYHFYLMLRPYLRIIRYYVNQSLTVCKPEKYF